MTKNYNNVVCFDFDGTICRQQKYGDGLIYEKPMPQAKKIIDRFKQKGFRIVVLTTRLNPKMGGDLKWKKWVIQHWLEKYEIPFDEITNNKPDADLYLDNKGFRFTGWSKIETSLKKFLPNYFLLKHQLKLK